jgi:hypothetical protein
MKKLSLYFSLMLVVAVFARCGSGGKDEAKSKDGAEASKTETKTEKKKAAECTPNQNLTFKVKGYKFGMEGDFVFDGKFEVKKAWFEPGKGTYTEKGKTVPVDKVDVRLANYDPTENSNPTKDGDILIKFTLYAKDGKLEPQTYKKGTMGKYYTTIDIHTTKGIVYFNWTADMPEEGNIDVTNFDGNKLCGEIKLKVDKPTDDKIGTVALNGTFYAEKK